MTFKISDGMLLGSQVLLDSDRVMTATDYDIKADYPTSSPALRLDFTNTNKLDTRITFTRNSIGTYTGASTHYSTNNLAPLSENLDTTLSRTTCTITSTTAVAAPVGTNITNRFIFAEGTTATREHYAYYNFLANNLLSDDQKVMTFSVYLKSGTHQYVQIMTGSPSTPVSYAGIVINLANGAVTQKVLQTSTVLNSLTYAVTDAGNGWYRCSITCIPGRYFFVGTVNNAATHVEDSTVYGIIKYTGSGSNTFYLCGWQIEYGTQPTAYNPTTTTAPVANKSMRTIKTAAANVPRFEYDPITGESKGLLIEEARTNLLTYSAQQSNAIWNKYNVTASTTDVVVAPDGTYANRIIENSSSGVEHYIEQTVSTNTNQTYTQSVYVKAGLGSTQFRLLAVHVGSLSGSTSEIGFTISGGVISPAAQTNNLITSAAAVSVGDGWYRCSITYTTTGTVTSHRMRIFPKTSGLYAGDGISGIYVWGAQLEVGSFASSYIPTVASTVTRQDDIVQITGTNFSSWYNNSATGGTIFCEVNDMDSSGTNSIRVAQLQGTNEGVDRIQIGAASNTTVTSFNIVSNSSASVGASFTIGSQINSNLKLAGAWATDDFAYTYNGNTPVPATTYVSVPTNIVSLVIGNKVSSGNVYGRSINGHIKSFRYYNTRLSNAQLQVLTA